MIRRAQRIIPEEPDDLVLEFLAGCVLAGFPIPERALVHAQEFAAFDRRHLQIVPSLQDVLADVPWVRGIPVGFP